MCVGNLGLSGFNGKPVESWSDSDLSSVVKDYQRPPENEAARRVAELQATGAQQELDRRGAAAAAQQATDKYNQQLEEQKAYWAKQQASQQDQLAAVQSQAPAARTIVQGKGQLSISGDQAAPVGASQAPSTTAAKPNRGKRSGLAISVPQQSQGSGVNLGI